MPDYRRGLKAGALGTLVLALTVVLVWWYLRPAPETPWEFTGAVPSPADSVAAERWPELHASAQQMLACVQTKAGRPLTITSAYRPGDSGYHGRRLAVDVRIAHGQEGYDLIAAGVGKCGATGFSAYTRHVHLDARPWERRATWPGGSSR